MPSYDLTDDSIKWDDAGVMTPTSNVVKTPLASFSPQLSRKETPEDREDSESRLRSEEEESLELARRLTAEEAMASYHQSFEILRQSADQLSQEEYDVLQAVLQEEQQGQLEDMADDDGDLSYETMLQLGERIGDVKTERWTVQAEKVISQLPSFHFNPSTKISADADDSECKCLVCQCSYEDGELLRRLRCGHCFHGDCVAQWLMTKDVCPYCRQSVVE
jgi:hypothetical protein